MMIEESILLFLNGYYHIGTDTMIFEFNTLIQWNQYDTETEAIHVMECAWWTRYDQTN